MWKKEASEGKQQIWEGELLHIGPQLALKAWRRQILA